MKAYEFEAVIHDGEVYCVECLPDGLSPYDEDVHPIFASDEMDAAPLCTVCGTDHDYMNVVPLD